MMNFLSKLEQMRLSVWVLQSGSVWAYPTILYLHTVGMMLLAGLGTVIALRLLGFSPKTPIRPLERLYPLMWLGFWINTVSGTILLMADATTKLTNADFYIKMVFVFAGVAALYLMRRKVFRDPYLDKAPVSWTAKALAWGMLICWFGAITAGRLLAYLGPVSGAPGYTNK